ncbi:MAG TPA: hypothetical protein VHU24_01325 [Solirubrobacterales bacterium]|nr:hypothetical protein [Solirubrobacterales bacterium]
MALSRKTGRESTRRKELTERTRQEGRALSRRRRAEARRLGPVVAPAARFASWIAPRITGALMFAIKLIAALIALIAEVGQVAIGWVVRRAMVLAGATARGLQRHVTPMSTVAFVGASAAVALGVSQFFNYHGVAVDAPAYAGEVGNVASAPMTGTETAGSAHLWVLIPIAAAAVVLVMATYRGHTRFAAAVSLCGVLGLAVALAIDLPQGLDAGRPGLAFSGAQAELLQGFWAEVASSAVLILCGGLLAHYSRGVAGERGDRVGTAVRRGRVSHDDGGGVSPGLQMES